MSERLEAVFAAIAIMMVLASWLLFARLWMGLRRPTGEAFVVAGVIVAGAVGALFHFHLAQQLFDFSGHSHADRGARREHGVRNDRTRTINGGPHLGCSDPAVLDRLIELGATADQQAASDYSAKLVATGDCVYFKDGEMVELDVREQDRVKIHRSADDTRGYWLPRKAIARAPVWRAG